MRCRRSFITTELDEGERIGLLVRPRCIRLKVESARPGSLPPCPSRPSRGHDHCSSRRASDPAAEGRSETEDWAWGEGS